MDRFHKFFRQVLFPWNLPFVYNFSYAVVRDSVLDASSASYQYLEVFKIYRLVYAYLREVLSYNINGKLHFLTFLEYFTGI